jgi:hypothetical protein
MWLLFLESKFFNPELIKFHTSKIITFRALYVYEGAVLISV